MTGHVGIVACSAEGAALCYRTICAEGAQRLGPHAHPEISMHTHSLADYVACLDRGDRIRYAQARVVMAVDADRVFQLRLDQADQPHDVAGQCAAVCVAQDDVPGPRVLRGKQRPERVRRVMAVSVEEMLGVVKDLDAVSGEETHGILDHLEVFLRRGLEHFFDMDQRRFAENGDDTRF